MNFKSSRFLIAMGTIVILAVLYGISLFTGWGGDPWLEYSTTLLPVLFAGFASLRAFRISRQMTDTHLYATWQLFAYGLASWMVAEGLWFYFELIQGNELPYPSLADGFWLLGYLLLVIGLWMQYNIYGTHGNLGRRRMFWLALLFVGIAWVLAPIVQDATETRWVEVFFNLAYPVLDGVILWLALSLMVSLERGQLATPWRWVLSGFFFLAFADLLFIYLSWRGLYYPEDTSTFWSLMSDYLYTLSYVILWVGLYQYWHINRQTSVMHHFPIAHEETQPLKVQNRMLLFTDANNRVILGTALWKTLLGFENSADLEGKRLGDVLPEFEPLLNKLKQQRMLRNALVSVRRETGETIPLRVSGLARYEEGTDRWVGGDLLVEALIPLADEDAMTEEQMKMADFIATKLGMLETEQRQVIEKYVQQAFAALRNEARKRVGDKITAAVLDEVKSKMTDAHYHATLDEESVHWRDNEEFNIVRAEAAALFVLLLERFGEHIGLQATESTIYRLQDTLSAREREILQTFRIWRE